MDFIRTVSQDTGRVWVGPGCSGKGSQISRASWGAVGQPAEPGGRGRVNQGGVRMNRGRQIGSEKKGEKAGWSACPR